MSRIGLSPIQIPEGVEVNVNGNEVVVKGPKGQLTHTFDAQFVEIKIEDGVITLVRKSEAKEYKARHGLYRSLLANMIEGVTNGFKKSLEIRGVGYRGSVQGSKVELHLGYSHPVYYEVPQGVTAEFDKEANNVINITGIDKQLVGQAAANIRSFRKPEPYKGKGIRYVDEYVAMKAGKSSSK
ncbi:MAG TPA: 50S ribosomal protein L6 [Candidatus Gracilibacteria bacterium]